VSQAVDALVVVDLQNDFMPFGALPVSGGDEVVGVANVLMPTFELVVATQDWHPADHGSFASNHEGAQSGEIVELGGVEQLLWPDHCVQHTPGAAFHSGLDIAHVDVVVHKGIDAGIDSYSAFFDNAHKRATGLQAVLEEAGAERVTLMGLATDYCVKYSVLDARALGIETRVVEDGCRGVEIERGDSKRAFDEMREVGAAILCSEDLL
jgi:nicotinamidase/pyrazinamidase